MFWVAPSVCRPCDSLVPGHPARGVPKWCVYPQQGPEPRVGVACAPAACTVARLSRLLQLRGSCCVRERGTRNDSHDLGCYGCLPGGNAGAAGTYDCPRAALSLSAASRSGRTLTCMKDCCLLGLWALKAIGLPRVFLQPAPRPVSSSCISTFVPGCSSHNLVMYLSQNLYGSL